MNEDKYTAHRRALARLGDCSHDDTMVMNTSGRFHLFCNICEHLIGPAPCQAIVIRNLNGIPCGMPATVRSEEHFLYCHDHAVLHGLAKPISEFGSRAMAESQSEAMQATVKELKRRIKEFEQNAKPKRHRPLSEVVRHKLKEGKDDQ